ncbi:MAG: hypothetical protein NXI23_25415 [Bacteroidetes bacterium]|nr:hypothetical protein [Bacteroidota bacterium]
MKKTKIALRDFENNNLRISLVPFSFLFVKIFDRSAAMLKKIASINEKTTTPNLRSLLIAKSLTSILLSLFLVSQMSAQYFGRNKPQYEKFDFEVLQTPNFEVYHYLKNKEILEDFAGHSEHWHHLHEGILDDTINGKNPIILYNNHADFQQTNTISGSVGIGTGGVTEGFKNRVIMPLAMSNQQTHHVLGHELVHAFQYNMILRGDSTNMKNLSNLPLWMIEGLAEYMSVGRVDAHTSMWMRDAVLNDDVPSIKKLSNPKYFPYRWGQAFWAFVTGIKGDEIIEPFFMATAKYGLEAAIKQHFTSDLKEFSKLWENTIKRHYSSIMPHEKENFVGRKLISKENAGNLNIAPVLSPNGKYVIFLSEKNLFSIDLFLANAVTGEILRKVASTTKDGHLDDFNYIESAGTWSPNSKKFAFVAVRKGQNILVIKEAQTGKTLEEFEIKGVPAFSNPSWSPDGKSIAVSGLVDGQVDIYSVKVNSKKVTQLTNDRASELHINWSKDGSQIVYSSDQLSLERGMNNGKWTFNLATLEIESGEINQLDIFYSADNLNPIFNNENNIIFLSNRDGFRNLYKYETTSGKVFQLTDFMTGVSGITHYAPAISTSTKAKRNRMLFTHYFENGYNIYRAKPEDFLNKEVSPNSIDFTAATLPKVNKNANSLVDNNLNAINQNYQSLAKTETKSVNYQPKFKLDYIGGGAGVGVGVSQNFGTQSGLQGGIDLLFGDMLGQHQIYSSIFLNGEIQDFGGTVNYLNKKGRVYWGVGLSHTPLRRDYFGQELINYQLDNGETITAIHEQYTTLRTFREQLSVLAQLPISKTLRLEGGLSLSSYANQVILTDLYYEANTGIFLERNREKLKPEELGLNLFKGRLASTNIALVGDNSYFGIASPLAGHRYRLDIGRTFGDFNYFDLTADFRKYIYTKPVSFAFRAMHTGRYGKDANSDALFTNYIGYPWYVRGYEFGSIQDGNLFQQLQGSKILVSNFEIRLPFTGPERLSMIKSKVFFSELALFADAGMAWSSFDEFKNDNLLQPEPLLSVGASLRVNVFGAFILEPYYAFPLHEGAQKGGVFGLNIVPGW